MTRTMLAWKSNRVDQEIRVPDRDILSTFSNCGGAWHAETAGNKQGCWMLNRPLDIQVSQHIAFCMDYAFEAVDYRKFSKRNWEELLDAMEARWERGEAAHAGG
mgnify:CR=1 FL=1